MLRITIPSGEYLDERTQEFVYLEGGSILLEHSLASISKWESKWKKPFLSKEQKTRAELIDYVRCMTLNSAEVDKKIYESFTQAHLNAIAKYIDDPMTATTFSERQGGRRGPKGEAVTAEIIYYWMVTLQIPFECQYWHLNKLLTLVRVCNLKNQPAKKQSKKDILSQNAKLNAERKKKLGTSG